MAGRGPTCCPRPTARSRFGQIFAMQPFANNVVTKSYTGAEIKAVLEQQFDSGLNTRGAAPTC